MASPAADHVLKRTGGSQAGNEHFLFHTRHAWSSLHVGTIRQPWELTVPALHKDVLEPFRKKLKVSGNLGPCITAGNDSADKSMPVKLNSFADAGLKLMKKTDEHLWELNITYERKAAYKKWTSLVLDDPLAWSVSRPKSGQDYMGYISQGIGESIKDCLGVKATGTLHNRVNPLIRYAQSLKDAGQQPFPMQEHQVYEFLKRADAAPSFPRSFITSVAFAKHVLGLFSADAVLESCRIKGFAALHFAQKRKLVQRPPLTVEQISYLERCVIDTRRTSYDRVAAGFFLVLTYGRLRFSDAQSITSLELEIPFGAQHGYLECAAERCKTATSLEKRTRLLPVVIPTKSFTDSGWVANWLEIRAQTKLEAGKGVPLLPNPASGGGWSKTPVTCEIAGDWLRALLKDVQNPKATVRLATHSCKSSMLSMCAKYGMEPSARRMLGYHSAGKDKSMLVYSRDSMAWPVRRMEEMIDEIVAQRFCPDASRSGYFPGESAAPADSKDCDSTSSSGDSQDEESMEHSEEEEAVEKFTGTWGDAGAVESSVYFRHVTSRCIHLTADESGLLFRCGRMVSSQYIKCNDVPKFLHPSCGACFKRQAK